jgi:NitT/TauT family transport system substrate-binding protein
MHRINRLLALLPILLVATACGSNAVQNTRPAAPAPGSGSPSAIVATPATGNASLAKVTVGYIPILIYAPIMIGVERGYFKDQGLQIDLQALAGGADMLTQTAAGNFDVGAGGIGSAYFNLAARARSLNQAQPIRIVAPLHSERPPLATPLVVGKKAFDEGRITHISDLKGKKVAINAPGAATEYWLEKALNTGGLTSKDVEVLSIPFPNIAQALDSGAIAGAMLGEPYATLGTQQGLVHVLNNAFLDGDQPTAVYYNSDWAGKHPKLAQGFMNGYLKAVRDLESGGWKDPATLAILSKYSQVPAETIAQAARPFGEPNGTVNIASIENQQTFFKQQGRLTYDQPLDIASLIDPQYAQGAVKALGSFTAH